MRKLGKFLVKENEVEETEPPLERVLSLRREDQGVYLSCNGRDLFRFVDGEKYIRWQKRGRPFGLVESLKQETGLVVDSDGYLKLKEWSK